MPRIVVFNRKRKGGYIWTKKVLLGKLIKFYTEIYYFFYAKISNTCTVTKINIWSSKVSSLEQLI